MPAAKVGLLPLYLELYDRAMPAARRPLAAFCDTIASELRARGLEVVRAPVCRIRPEFAAAVQTFEGSGAQAIITLHLAYSPSLESVDALAATKLPIIVLDTTPDESFGPLQDPALLMNNHGVHGVQDMCNLLRRRGKPFIIEAGHWRRSDVLNRVCGHAIAGSPALPGSASAHPAHECQIGRPVRNKATQLICAMRRARVGRIGQNFKGMGDFQVPEHVLKSKLGIEVAAVAFDRLCGLMPAADDPAVIEEIARDREAFAVAADLDADAHIASVRASLAVRRWIEGEHLTAFTINFDDVRRDSGLPAVPFLEASKGMARGIGYAGEGDVLTAAFVGALATVYPETSFTEIFCPDWAGETLFLSHMAEMNIALCSSTPALRVKPMPWMELDRPAVALGRFRGGQAVFANLAPAPDDHFTLIIAPVRVLDVQDDQMPDMVRGWIRPGVPIADFLEAYSRAGGTHHSALVYGDVAGDLAAFGISMNYEVVMLQ